MTPQAEGYIHQSPKHKTRYVTISEDEYESMKATIEVLRNQELVKRIIEGEKAIREGRERDIDEVMKERGII